MATVVKAPNKYSMEPSVPTVFLGGVIDQGTAKHWSKLIADALAEFDVLVLDPRRDEWDETWEQSVDNPEFVQQVEWELKGQDDADIHVYVFASDEEEAKTSKAPITFLEFGMYGKRDAVLVCCPQGFYRKGNVDITARWIGVPVYDELDDLIADLKELLKAQ